MELNELATLDTMLDASTNPVAPVTPVVETPVASVETPAEPTTIIETPDIPAETTPPAVPPVAEPVDNDPENVFANKSKQNAAFAQQRMENKQLRDTVSRLAKTLGIEETTDLNKTVGALNAKLLEYEATQTNVPLPVLQEQERNLTRTQELEKELYKQKATIGFATVQNQYKLTAEQVREFAEQVLDAGKNPFAEAVDLVKEYQMLNFDKILQQTRDDERQANVARQKKAAEHSSTPMVNVGGTPASVGAVGTVTDLNRMLDELSHK